MSLIQVEDLVSYQLRTSYLSEVADGVGERLITINDSFLNTAPFKAAGWRSNPSHIKRTHSPPIPTAIASEYFQAAPRSTGLTLEDEAEEGGMLTGGGDTLGPGSALKRRRERRREQMEEDDSSDLSDESDDDTDQRAAQQIRFAKMPLRSRAGSSPIQSSNLRQATNMSSPRATPVPRRGSQPTLETVKERPRRDTVTSSEISSDNEFDASGYHKNKEAARTRATRSHSRTTLESSQGIRHHESDLLAEEDENSDMSDTSSAFVESVDSTSILDTVENPAVGTSPGQQVVGNVPKQLLRQSTIRKPAPPAQPQVLQALPPPRPMSTIRPLSMAPPRSLLSDAFKAKNTKPAMPFDAFASLSGQGDPDPLRIRIYAPFSEDPETPFEVPIRRNIQEADGTFRPVTVAELIGLSLWRYHAEKLQPPVPADKLNVNWWTLRMVEEGGEVDDDFEPLDRKKPVNSFTTANNRAARSRSASKAYDEFALVQASEAGFADNQVQTPQYEQQDVAETVNDEEATPKSTPQPQVSPLAAAHPRSNPIITTTYRVDTPLADKPPPQASAPATSRGQHKLLKVHILSSNTAPGQMVTLDVTTDMYLAEVLDLVCRKRQLDKNTHVLKLPDSGAVVLVDRTVSSIGNVEDLELHRRRFATDGPLTIGSPSSPSPKPHVWNEPPLKGKKKLMTPHPLAQENIMQDEAGSGDVKYKKYTVWRKQTMRFVGMNERILVIDGEYVYIQPSSGGKAIREGGKTTTVHFSNVVGCSVSRRHPTNFKLLVYKATESKRYDFEARSAQEAAEIVRELKKGISPYNRDI
ncbi:Stress-activated map kinase-interacting protein 1 [Daldinia childiae]|uniref:Stress-activated map kinase-interacting protein 1 n=1 Tax=Daldinia childiae TaxID=326645 RepID=UPI0014470F7E|nr:Stress-activated map kinase-interacting protein 1 [Daldinia childiae]KAF3064404.1 Stress-activated map kinase-interacting protein 1 [Daldinia childiae]